MMTPTAPSLPASAPVIRPASLPPHPSAPAPEFPVPASSPAPPQGEAGPSDEAAASSPAPRPAVTTRDVMWRILEIHRLLNARPRRAPTAQNLADEVGTSPRNVQRDIAVMRHTYRLPIASKGQRGGYYYTRPNVEFGGAAASASELVALAVAAQMVRAYASTRLEEGVRGALRKLRLEARADHGLDLDHLADVLSFRGTGFDLITDHDLFERLTMAALRREELHLSYQGTEDLLPRERTVEPWRLFCEDNAWYLRAWDRAARGIRHFCLGRMGEVRATGRSFVRTPRQIRADARFDDALGAFNGGPKVRVVMVLRGRAACSVRRRSWHKSQQVRVLGPRETELELRVSDNPGLLHFALRWGADARVMEPASLREKVLAHARAVLAQG